ncbi:glycosyltransferase family 4 protein [Vibrio diabolicus]|uniref:glycosyltransferase family 4 protein n=1 Tax=Vibrio diabolicus TaxID=50719 RepID=UPI003751C314
MGAKVIIIQPCVLRYRVGLYKELSNKFGYSNLKVLAPSRSSDGQESYHIVKNYFNLDQRITECKIWKFYYQKLSLGQLKEYSHVVVTGNPKYISNYLLYVYCKLHGIKVVWWGQGWSAKTNKLSYLARRMIMKLFDSVILYTESEAKEMARHRIRPKITGYTDNGLDVSEIDNYRINDNLSSVSSKESINLIFIGRITQKSKFPLLLSAMENIAEKFHLHVIGDGQIDENCKLMIENLGKRVTFHGAIQSECKIAGIMNYMDFFVYPGSVGLSLIHSFAYGLPAIIHNNRIAHMPEVAAFEDGLNGLTFKENDVSDLTATLSRTEVLINTESYKNMRINARKVVDVKYNTTSMAEKFKQTIDIT